MKEYNATLIDYGEGKGKLVVESEFGKVTFAVKADSHMFVALERPHGEWIPCSESLPEECENVLAWIECNAWVNGSDYPKRRQESAIGWHIEGRWHFDGYAGSTTVCLAWMPLPEPFKRGESK